MMLSKKKKLGDQKKKEKSWKCRWRLDEERKILEMQMEMKKKEKKVKKMKRRQFIK